MVNAYFSLTEEFNREGVIALLASGQVEASQTQPPSTLHDVLLREFATPPPPAWPPNAPQAPVTSATPEPTPVPPAEEVRTGLDGERDRAAFLKPRLEEMAQGARRLKGLRSDYDQACAGEMIVTYKDESGQGQTGSIRKAETPECVSRAGVISGLQDGLKKEGAELEEVARRARVLPGILRELVAAYALEGYMNP